MPLKLSDVAKVEKNKIDSDGVWLVLLEIILRLPDGEKLALKVVRNNEDIVWNGETWIAFPFDLDDVSEDAMGEIPQLTVKVSNVTGTVQRYVEEANGAVGATVKLYVVHSHNLDEGSAEIEEAFTVRAVKCDSYWVHFTLSGDYPTLRRIPETRYLKDFCPFKFKGLECGYTSDDRTTYVNKNQFMLQLDQTKRYGVGDRILLIASTGSFATRVVESQYKNAQTIITIPEEDIIPLDLEKVAFIRCNKTLGDCRKRKNNKRFGGEPAIPDGGAYKSNPY